MFAVLSEWLFVLLIGTNVFWAWQVHRLVNKLMSRNYFEFKEADKPREKVEPKVQQAIDDSEDYGGISELTGNV